MDSNFSNSQINHEETLASGDASCTDYLFLSPSITDLLPHPDTELENEIKNADIWRYEVVSAEKLPVESADFTPKFFPIGSLRKTQYHDVSKREGKTNLHGLKRENKLTERNNKNLKGSHSNECFTPQQSRPALNFVSMSRLFSCQACHVTPITSMTVHTCAHGHQVCGNCFNHDTACAVCGQPLDGRNQPVEAALLKLKSLRPELFFQEFLSPSITDNMEEAGHMRAMQYSSHKPVQCPHLSCRSTIAYNGILLHFKFEHSAVPVVSTYSNCPHNFPLQESLLNDKTARTLMVFKVGLFKTKSRRYEVDPVICCLLAVPIEIGCVKSLAVWCSSIYDDGISSPLAYSLKSTNPRRSMGYRGPTASLQENFESILTDGRCLIVPPDMLESFTIQNESSSTLQIEFYKNNIL